MKKFFRHVCVCNASGIAAFILVCIFLFAAWQLISSGSLLVQILVAMCVLYFVCTAIVGFVIALGDWIRGIIAKKKSAPTEVSAE